MVRRHAVPFTMKPFILIVAVMVAVPALAGTDYYVSPTGSDANAGTQAAPFKNITKAASAVIAGGTVHVRPGIYAGQFATTASGTAEARIRYVSDIKWSAKIVP